MRIGFAEGRAFRAEDRDGAPNVCIVNESLARHVFPGESALGKIADARPQRRHQGARSSA